MLNRLQCPNADQSTLKVGRILELWQQDSILFAPLVEDFTSPLMLNLPLLIVDEDVGHGHFGLIGAINDNRFSCSCCRQLRLLILACQFFMVGLGGRRIRTAAIFLRCSSSMELTRYSACSRCGCCFFLCSHLLVKILREWLYHGLADLLMINLKL